jgi:divinyl protochlorophyllide a 8-vinyl-reductase
MPTRPPSTRKSEIATPISESRARVGPNAAIQVIAALKRRGESMARRVAAGADLSRWIEAPPAEMIAETDAAHLHAAVRDLLPADEARAVLYEAGVATADYLLANRIPKPAQWVLRLAPTRYSARWLSQAIGANAWTFAGSGRFTAKLGRRTVYEISANPFCAEVISPAPICIWHVGVFERLFGQLVSRRIRVVETECCAAGSLCCRFVLAWKRSE